MRRSAALTISVLAVLGLAACASSSKKFYQSDGPPGAHELPSHIGSTPDAVPRVEPFHPYSQRPYKVLGRWYRPMTSDAPMKQRGMASWYGKQFHGNKTAIGERYDMFAMSAAHPTMPLPSYAKVSNPKNGRSIVVRVNDRGPFLHGRIIDLSYAAAVKLGVAHGVSEVIVERLTHRQIREHGFSIQRPNSPDAPHDEGPWSVQLGAFSERQNAQALREQLSGRLSASALPTAFVEQSAGFYRVLVGRLRARDDAQTLAERLQTLLSQETTLFLRSHSQ